DQQPEPAQARLALEPGDEVVREPHALEGRAEHELARVEDERLLADLDELRQLLLRLLAVDERVAAVAEDAEVAVDADVHARRLEERGIVGADLDPALLEQPGDRAVGENHDLPILAGSYAPGDGGHPHDPAPYRDPGAALARDRRAHQPCGRAPARAHLPGGRG